MTDQLRPDFLGYAGGPAHTPNIDRLAAEGMVFDNAFTNCPICAPARIALATGLQVSRNAMISNQAVLSRHQTTYMQRLRDYGHRVGCVGKLDLCKSVGDPGVDGAHPRTFTWGFTHPVEVEGKWHAGKSAEPFGPYTQALEERGCLRRFHDDYQNRKGRTFAEASYPSAVPDDLFADIWIGDRSVGWLDALPQDLPWHLFVSFVGPHDPFDPPGRLAQKYENAEMPPAIADELAGKPEWLRSFRHYNPLSEEETVRARRHYCGAIEAIDEAVGSILDALERRGERDNTVIVFSSDHGESLGDHGLWEKQVAYEPSIRIPLIVSGPGARRGARSDALVELIDLNPTICELSGLPAQEDIDARSLASCLSGTTSEHREHIHTAMPFYQCVRTRKYKLIDNVNDIVELYDIESDPHELHNIAESKPETVQELKALLKRRLTDGVWRR
jgi:choline-sulfatase